MIEAQPLDIQPSDLYRSYAYDYPMELQQTLFRYSPDSDSASRKVVGVPLNQGAKNRARWNKHYWKHRDTLLSKCKERYKKSCENIQYSNKLCKCGCGQIIMIKSYHKYYGIPNYISGHQAKKLNLNEKNVIKLYEDTDLSTQDIAKTFNCSLPTIKKIL